MPVIFFAVRRGEPEVVRRLLEAGANPNISIASEVSLLVYVLPLQCNVDIANWGQHDHVTE